MSQDLGINEYAKAASELAIYPEALKGTKLSLCYVLLGLANEAGEAAGKLKKVLRGDKDNIRIFDAEGALTDEGRSFLQENLGPEVTDTFWYGAMALLELGILPSEALQANIDKLQSRKNRGQLKGDGDNR